jgi:hypothetical protein
MKRRSWRSRFISVFLLVLVSQKSGTELYIHSSCHLVSSTQSRTESNIHQEQLNRNCHCIDDFLTLFDMDAGAIVFHHTLFPLTIPVYFKEQIPTVTPATLFLRGPPAHTA